MTSFQAMKRIPRVTFPQRHPKLSGSASQPEAASIAGDVHSTPFSKSGVSGAINTSVGGKASSQPKRIPVSDREIDAILLGGCIYYF